MSRMNLNQWRQTRDMTMKEASILLGLESARTYQRYETGENRPDAPLIERIMAATDGAVTLADLHRQRLEWLRENKPEVFARNAMEAAE